MACWTPAALGAAVQAAAQDDADGQRPAEEA